MKLNHVMLILFVLLSLAVMAFAPLQDAIPVPPITAASLAVILAAVLTIVADYVPGVASWFDALTIPTKRVVMLLGAVLIVGVVFAGQCYGFLATNLICTPAGAVDVLSNVILAYVTGQGVHVGSKPSAEFKKETLDINPKKANTVGI